jgi:hypothetical protein
VAWGKSGPNPVAKASDTLRANLQRLLNLVLVFCKKAMILEIVEARLPASNYCKLNYRPNLLYTL